MPSNNNKKIRERVIKMNNAWKQGAPTVTFKGIKQSDFQTDIESAAAKDQEIADLEAQVQMKKQERDAIYRKLNDDSIKVRDGVEGDINFGTNHPLYEGMGFTTDDNRASGLTRKKKAPSGTNG
ncbi:MAG: hypothetical protein QOC96_3086 [Acidobacteriota bacterium]|jgi:tRNA splicing endonuclease|nr:hypothetical protein [Acidobacteriota bacterium]